MGKRCSSTARAALTGFIVAIAAWSSAAQAKITRIVVDDQERIEGDGTARLPAYEKLRGRLFGEVDPLEQSNSIIQDIELAPRNERGRVEYIATFTLLRPAGASQGNRVIISTLPNRGNRYNYVEFGQGWPFLRSRGYSVLWVGWQGDLPEKPSAASSVRALHLESLNAPRARRADGAPLTGPYLIRVPTVDGEAPTGPIMRLDQGRAGPLAYFPASYDPRDSKLTGGVGEGMDGRALGPRYAVPHSDWMWWNCARNVRADDTVQSPADLCIKRIKGTFQPTESYTLVFTARDPLVLGLGMAAVRDAVSFFRYAAADAAGTANPMAHRIDQAIGHGFSQVGNLIKTFVALGFNADEQDRRVFDGAHAHIAGRRAPINYRFATPGSSATLYMPGSEGVLWWGEAADQRLGGKAVSMLDRCNRTQTCPKIFETFGGAELWNQRMATGLVTLDLKHDIPLPPNVRRYFFPGTAHAGGRGGFRLDGQLAVDRGACVLAPNPNPETEQIRALLLALTDWIKQDTPPPASRYPTLAARQLVRDTPRALKLPGWPDAARPYGIANPLLVYDYGSSFDNVDMSGVITRLPPLIRDVIPALVPQVDADGNEVGGVPSVYMMAPLGSYLSWNLYRSGPYRGQICSYYGAFVPFAKTRAERLAMGDERVSLQERYGSRSGYVRAVRHATERAVQERFLVAEDATRLINEARDATENGDLRFLPESAMISAQEDCARAPPGAGRTGAANCDGVQ